MSGHLRMIPLNFSPRFQASGQPPKTCVEWENCGKCMASGFYIMFPSTHPSMESRHHNGLSKNNRVRMATNPLSHGNGTSSPPIKSYERLVMFHCKKARKPHYEMNTLFVPSWRKSMDVDFEPLLNRFQWRSEIDRNR